MEHKMGNGTKEKHRTNLLTNKSLFNYRTYQSRVSLHRNNS